MWFAEATVMWMAIFGGLPRKAFFETLKKKTPYYYLHRGPNQTVSMGWLWAEQDLHPQSKIFQGGVERRNLYWFSLAARKVADNLTNHWTPHQSYLFCISSFVLSLEWIAVEMSFSDILIFLNLLFLQKKNIKNTSRFECPCRTEQ